jgi:hypothetical protein
MAVSKLGTCSVVDTASRCDDQAVDVAEANPRDGSSALVIVNPKEAVRLPNALEPRFHLMSAPNRVLKHPSDNFKPLLPAV